MVREVIEQDVVSESSALVVQRWRRYGHDRAYVEVEGQPIGYRDLRTGEVRAEDPANAAMIEDATATLLVTSAASDVREYEPLKDEALEDEALEDDVREDEAPEDDTHEDDALEVSPRALPYVPRHAAPEWNNRHFVRGFRKRTR